MSSGQAAALSQNGQPRRAGWSGRRNPPPASRAVPYSPASDRLAGELPGFLGELGVCGPQVGEADALGCVGGKTGESGASTGKPDQRAPGHGPGSFRFLGMHTSFSGRPDACSRPERFDLRFACGQKLYSRLARATQHRGDVLHECSDRFLRSSCSLVCVLQATRRSRRCVHLRRPPASSSSAGSRCSKAGATPTQINLVLLAATAGGVPLARRLLAAGASLRRATASAPCRWRTRRARATSRWSIFSSPQGAAIDARNLAGATALYGAAENERQAIVAPAAGKGRRSESGRPLGVTPLAAAAFKGNDRIVEPLLARGADPESSTRPARRPSSMRPRAASADRAPAARCRRRRQRAYGNDLTALMWAAGHDDGVGGAARRRGRNAPARRGARIDAVDNRGRTALMMAAELGHAAVVDALLARGADRTLMDKSGKSALDLAADESVRAKLMSK